MANEEEEVVEYELPDGHEFEQGEDSESRHIRKRVWTKEERQNYRHMLRVSRYPWEAWIPPLLKHRHNGKPKTTGYIALSFVISCLLLIQMAIASFVGPNVMRPIGDIVQDALDAGSRIEIEIIPKEDEEEAYISKDLYKETA